jgi:hypothetical protein
MIRIEGIPIVAARLEAALKSARVTPNVRPARPTWMRLLPTFSRTVRRRQPLKDTRDAEAGLAMQACGQTQGGLVE